MLHVLIAVLRDFVWRADIIATWCIGNREMESQARVNPYLGGEGRFAPHNYKVCNLVVV